MFSRQKAGAILASLSVLLDVASSAACPSPPSTPSCTSAYFQSTIPCGSNATVEYAGLVQSGTFGQGVYGNATSLPQNLGAVLVHVSNTTVNPPSDYRFGLFLPAQWQGRFLTVGNGGFVGGVNWPDMGAGVHYGAASMSTDTGHMSGGVADWGYRAMYGSYEMAKQIVATYYRKPTGHTYYSGCSTGGRQGFKQIELAPDSFDGALIGAPAWNTDQLMPWIYHLAIEDTGSNGLPIWDPSEDATHPTPALDTFAAAVLAQCDHLDGVTDNIISAPALCNVNLDALSCNSSTSASTACLQPPQVAVIRDVYADWVVDGTLIMEGFLPGSERGWSSYLSNYSINAYYGAFAYQWPLYFLYNDTWPNGKPPSANVVAQNAAAVDPGKATVDSSTFSLAGYNGKIILYQGLADGTISPNATTRLYDAIRHNTAAAAGGGDTAAFFKYFQVPGMQDCYFSDAAVNAPWMFNGADQAGQLQALGALESWIPASYQTGWGTPPYGNNSRYDALQALMDWVEEPGFAAGFTNITAVAYNADWSVNRTRPLCPYPQRQVPLNASLSARQLDDADNWTCQG